MLKKGGIELIGSDEEFAYIPAWKNYYISNYGRFLRKINNGWRIIHPCMLNSGYYSYTLNKPARKYMGKKVKDENGRSKGQKQTMTAQRLVALLFNDNYYGDKVSFKDLQVHHKNGDRKNNYYKNLLLLKKDDHRFVDKLKKIAMLNENTGKLRAADIEVISKKLGIDVIDLIQQLRKGKAIYKSDDGKYDIFKVADRFIGIEWKIHRKKKRKK